MSRTVVLIVMLLGVFAAGCEETDIGMMTEAGKDAVKAVTLDDEDVVRMAVQVARQADEEHTVAPPDNRYAKRLEKLTRDLPEIQEQEFNFKVYLSPQANAFAMADGSIRIYSGLMDMMTDRELQFVIGHEIGHVVNEDIKEKIRLAYASSAVRKAIASQRNEVGVLASSGVGALMESVLNAQYSQNEEREADDYGLQFLKSLGYSGQAAVTALEKLGSLGSNHSFLSSHPAPASRAERIEKKRVSPEPEQDTSFFARIIQWFEELWPFGDLAVVGS